MLRVSSRYFPVTRTALTRTFMSSSPTKSPWADELPKPIEELNTYLCILPDFTEGSKRMDVRPTHLQQSNFGHGRWIVKAGAMFADDHGVNNPPKMIGSWFLMREESKEKAFARLSRDIYATGSAWDMSKATITAVAVSKHEEKGEDKAR